ncbi:MAG: type II secretion system F family protein [Hahellaceae bacterium]|nr:type II secretion system F family protein [Hahellaceae bacterium]MCP5168201.1 type II secretion system F family protein [Hahellaceae bacterium]
MTNRASDEMDVLQLVRHLDQLLAKGVNLQEAISRLRASVPAAAQPGLNGLAQLAQGQFPADVGAAQMPELSALQGLIQAAHREGGNALAMLRALSQWRSPLQESLTQLTSEFKNLLGYVLSIASVTLVCLWLFVTKVFPQYEAFYSDYGAQLPELTRVTLDTGQMLAPMGYLLIPIVIWYVIQVQRLGRQLGQWQPLDRSFSVTPGLHRIKRQHTHTLFLLYAGLLVKSGLKGRAALSVAETLTACPRTSLPLSLAGHLELAEKTETLEDELTYQLQHLYSGFIQRLLSMRQRVTLISQTLLAIIVGWLVIAMYLPIFALGNAL